MHTCGCAGGGFGASAIDSFSLYFLLSLTTTLSWRRENGSFEKECREVELNGDVGAGERIRVDLFLGAAVLVARFGCSDDDDMVGLKISPLG